MLYQGTLVPDDGFGKLTIYSVFIGCTGVPWYFNNQACRKRRRAEDGDKKQGTALSEKIWEIKDKGKTPEIKWKIVDKAYPYKAGAKACDLCRAEKMHIARGAKGFSKLPQGCVILNKKSEIMAKCPHMRKFSLAEAKIT